MKKEYKMSAARQQELQDELTYLKTVREKEVAELIKEARGFGDLSENSEYDEAKNEQGKLYSRIAELEDILLHVVIIDESEGASNAVSIGCTVTVVDLKTGREMPPYKVVGSQEADPMHRAISEESPFGKALMGAKEGDEISVEAPVGIIHYRVEKIERYGSRTIIRRKRYGREQSGKRSRAGAGPFRNSQGPPRKAGGAARRGTRSLPADAL